LRRPSLPLFLLGSRRREGTVTVGSAGRHDGRSVEGLVAARRKRRRLETTARLQPMRLSLTDTTTSLISYAHPKESWTAAGRE